MISLATNQIFNTQLSNTIDKAFSELAFMIPDETETKSIYETQWEYICKVDFTGPFQGQLIAGIDAKLVEPLVENMIGVEPGEALPEGVCQLDAFKELINVVCGNFLPLIAGDQVVFDISAPVLLTQNQLTENANDIPELCAIKVDVEQGHAGFAFLGDFEKIRDKIIITKTRD